MILAADPSTVAGANALAGLPVAVVVVVVFLGAWRLNARGDLITGREHRGIVDELRTGHAATVTELERRATTAEADVIRWQSAALRALNVSEAVLGRRDEGGT